MELFCYGTLIVPQVWRRVVGRLRPARPALLPGYARCRVAGEPWPAVVAQPGAETEGLVYSGLTGGDLRRLDAYEGRLYRRVRVEVEDTEGSRRPVWTYEIRPCYRHRLQRGDWQPVRGSSEKGKLTAHPLWRYT